jgi:hypothetical protein
MTPLSRLAGSVAAVATVATLALPAAAGARAGEKTLHQTYPRAAELCERVAAGKEGKHLKRLATRVLADCTALQTGFTNAKNTVLSTRAALTAQIVADQAAIAAACPTKFDQPPTCEAARRPKLQAIGALMTQIRQAGRQYYLTVEALNEGFWKQIRALPGERRVRADAPIPELPA